LNSFSFNARIGLDETISKKTSNGATIMNARRPIAVFIALVFLGSLAHADPAPKDSKDEAKPIALPKDPKAVVLSYDPGAGGFIRKGEAPYLKIKADGQITVTSLVDGSKKETKLTAKELDDLLRFVIQEKDFFNLSEMKIADAVKDASKKGPFIAVGGAGTTVIGVEANGKKHEVKYRAAAAYLQAYPNAEPLAKFAAIEKRLSEIAAAIMKNK
jgi:hypothetical protein